jgi:hypothetical protein
MPMAWPFGDSGCGSATTPFFPFDRQRLDCTSNRAMQLDFDVADL